jgi:RimJ/RimL family protein N-acetyltransferase
MDLSGLRLRSPRLALTSFEPDDAADVREPVTPSLTRYLSFEPAPSAEAFAEIWRQWLAEMVAGTNLMLVVRLLASGEFLGVTGLHGLDGGEPEAGIWIKEAAHGLGYGREAVAAALDWAVDALGIRSVVYPVVAANRASRRLAERLGGAIIDTRRLTKPGGVEHPVVVYRIPATRASGAAVAG